MYLQVVNLILERRRFRIVVLMTSCKDECFILWMYSRFTLSFSGFRGVVTISNKRNAPADFSWKIANGKDGTSFSIRPSKGTWFAEVWTTYECSLNHDLLISVYSRYRRGILVIRLRGSVLSFLRLVKNNSICFTCWRRKPIETSLSSSGNWERIKL